LAPNRATSLPPHDRLAGLAAFLPVFQSPGFEFGHWGGGEKTTGGATQMPYYVLSDEAAAFVQAAYDFGWVLPSFDWSAWKDTPEAMRLRDDPDALAAASAEQRTRLVTVLIRQNRFVEGGLASAFDSGLLTAIVARAEPLMGDGGP
jgi:hypothetical protein